MLIPTFKNYTNSILYLRKSPLFKLGQLSISKMKFVAISIIKIHYIFVKSLNKMRYALNNN